MIKKSIIAMLASIMMILLSAAAYLFHAGYKLPDNDPSWFLENKSRFSGKRAVVCIGDSITHAKTGCNYVDILGKRLGSDYVMVNAGVNSELSYNVLQRLDGIIKCEPDFVTILIGTNDSKDSFSEEAAAKKMKQMKLPRRPGAEWFQSNLVEMISRLKAKTNARIAILSLPPITEDINHPRYIHSLQFVRIIKAAAQEQRIAYLPLRERTEKVISKIHSKPSLKFEDRELEAQLGFVRNYLFKTGWDDISRENGFVFLTDYVHLNCESAKMISDMIEEFIKGGGNYEPGY